MNNDAKCPHCHSERANPVVAVCPYCKILYDARKVNPQLLAKLKQRAGIIEPRSRFSVVIDMLSWMLNGTGHVLFKLGKLICVIIGVLLLLKFCSAIADSKISGSGIGGGLFSILLFLWALASASTRSEGDGLHKKFISLGVLAGKTEAEITEAVGLPVSRSAMVDGGVLLQWQASGFHIALIFDENRICKGISHEFVYRG
jgi:hypothetical protein